MLIFLAPRLLLIIAKLAIVPNIIKSEIKLTKLRPILSDSSITVRRIQG